MKKYAANIILCNRIHILDLLLQCMKLTICSMGLLPLTVKLCHVMYTKTYWRIKTFNNDALNASPPFSLLKDPNESCRRKTSRIFLTETIVQTLSLEGLLLFYKKGLQYGAKMDYLWQNCVK